MGRLDDSILVMVDCTNLSGRAREDLFMNSRDRLRNHELRDEIERELEILLRDHPGLRALREKRRNEEIQTQIGNSKPLEEAIKSILKSSPSLSSLFLTGTRLSNPFKTKQVSSEDAPYKGNLHPSYFKFHKLDYGKVLERITAINMRCRVTFETDVDNDYFYRLQNRGKFNLLIMDSGEVKEVHTYSLNLQNGKATLNVRLPANCSVGDKFKYEARVTDEVILQPFINLFMVTIGPPQTLQVNPPIKDGKSPSDKDGTQREIPTGMQIPEVNDVYEQDWDKRKHKFDQYSALEILQEEAANIEETGYSSNDIYSFWVNVDNIYLKAEEKYSKTSPDIIKARYKYGLVLIGMALIQADAAPDKSKEHESNGEIINGEELPLAERVYKASSAIAPVLLPLIDSLGNLTEDQVKVGSQVGDDE